MSTIVAPAAERRDPGATPDSELVAAVRAGDDRAFERLYERYHRRIAAYVYGMVNDYGRAEDLTQDVFISALRRMRQTARPIAFKPWIYEIAKNACIDQFRRARRGEEVSFEAEESAGGVETGRLAAVECGPDAVMDAKQQIDHLCGAFGGLSDTHHQILVMRELEGLSYREIGEKMGLSRPSVESTLFRARRRLTEEYDELVSGERCLRVQSIILTAVDGLGSRDQRRMLRHVAHCQPCRREARLAGVEVGALSRHPVRDAVAAKVAAFLPFPFLVRGRRGAGETASGGVASNLGGSFPGMAEPIAGWGKAAIAAATLVVAGAGTGAVTTVVGDDEPVPARSTPAALTPAASQPAADKARAFEPAAGGESREANRRERRAAARERSGATSDATASAPKSSPAPSSPSGTATEQQQPAALVPGVPTTVTPSGGITLSSDGSTGGSVLPQELRAPATSENLADQITDAAGGMEPSPGAVGEQITGLGG